MTNPVKESEFMKLVEHHERSWGTKGYPGRPKLSDVLTSPVVVFWQEKDKGENYTVSLHADLVEIEKQFLRILIASSLDQPQKKLIRIFEHHKRIVVKRVKVLFDHAPDS